MTPNNGDPGFKVNYSLRPAKCIERKMVAEALHRLNVFHELKSYQYIGFGSAWFSDFILVHRSLGIHDMVSIEEDVAHDKRYEFNRPFKCIKLRFGPSNSILPTLTLNKQVIIWLDYTCRLNPSVLEDIRYTSSKAIPGSVLIITVNSDPISENDFDLISRSVSDKGIDYKQVHAKNKERFGLWATANSYRRMVKDKILLTLRSRNGVLNQDDRVHYQQIFNFNYQDSQSKMLTTGGLFFQEQQKSLVDKCRFSSSFDFFKPDDDPYLIEVPILTLREIRMLDAQLPADCAIDRHAIPQIDVERYEKIYRYHPAFVEAEL